MKWEKSKVDVVRNNKQTTSVEAELYGPLCIHRPLVAWRRKPCGWVITHAATGLRCGVIFRTKKDAKLITEYLVDTYGAVFGLTTDKEVCAAVPRDVVAWLRECSARGIYIDPVPA